MASQHPPRWPCALAALVLAGVGAAASYLGASQTTYPELIVGAPAWTAANKTCDFALLLGFMASFLPAYAGLHFITAWRARTRGERSARRFEWALVWSCLPALVWVGSTVARHRPLLLATAVLCAAAYGALHLVAAGLARMHDEAAAGVFERVLAWSCAPAVLWLASWIVSARPVGLALWISAALCATALAVGGIALRSPAGPRSPRELRRWLEAAVLTVALALPAGLAVPLACDRLDPYLPLGVAPSPSVAGLASVGAALLAGGTITWVLLRPGREAPWRGRQLRRLLTGVQALLPLLFVVLLPTPRVLDDERRVSGADPTWAYGLLVVGLMVAGWSELGWRARRRPAQGKKLALLGLLAVLLLVTVPSGATFGFDDDFHRGEFVLPWWLAERGFVPFQDYVPSRGLVNYLPGAAADVLLDSPAPDPLGRAGTAVPFALAQGLAFLLVAHAVGPGWAFLGFLALPVDSLTAINALVMAALVVLVRGVVTWRPRSWLAVWFLSGTTLVLLATGQGGLLVLGTAPLGLVQLWRAWSDDPSATVTAAGATVGGIGLVAALTPVGPMLLGAVRYGLEQSRVNALAHGIPWQRSWEGGVSFLEVIRTSFAAAAALALAVGWHAWLGPASRRRSYLVALSCGIAPVLALYTFRAAGRIDWPGLSRLGLVSAVAATILAPALLAATTRGRARSRAVIAIALWGGLLAGGIGGIRPLETRVGEARSAPETATSARSPQLPGVDEAQLAPHYREELARLRRGLSSLLQPGAAFVDLTNRGAVHRYLERPPAIEAAVYNLPTAEQQLRAVRRIERQTVDAAWFGPRSFQGEGGPVSLRCHLLYRHLVTRFVPAERERLWFLVRQPRGAGISARGMRLLVAGFHPRELALVSAAWGRSYETLRPRLRRVLQLGPPSDVEGGTVTAGGGVALTASDAVVTYDLSARRLSGGDAGILALHLSCTAPLRLRLDWRPEGVDREEPGWSVELDARSGRLIVPLDACPRWLLSERVGVLRLHFASPSPAPGAGDDATIRAVELLQRRAADRLRSLGED